MQLSQIVRDIDGVGGADRGGGDVAVDDVRFDSRRVGVGDLFVALEGEEADGHDYLEAAVDAGAEAVMVAEGRRRSAPEGVPTLVADEPRRRLGPVAALVHGRPADDLELVGVTGTNGKTTTTSLIGAIFEADGRTVGRVGTTGYRWPGTSVEGPNTTPESATLQRMLARMRDDGVDTVAMEVSSHGLAMHRVRGTSFDCAVLTNLSEDHLDFHGDMATYRRVKASLFREHLGRGGDIEGVAALNVGDELGRSLCDELVGESGVDVVDYGLEDQLAGMEATVVGRDPALSLDGVAFELEMEEGTSRVQTSLVGAFNVQNGLAAAAAARGLGVDPAVVVEGLEAVDGVDGRAERVDDGTDDGPAAFVDYAHTPDALERILETVGRVTQGRLVAVFGCGGDRDRRKRPEMGRIADELADLAVVTSDNPRSERREAIIDEILEGVSRPVASDEQPPSRGVWVEPDRRRAIRSAVREASEGDTVVVAGKGHETYQEVGTETRPFDDRLELEEAFEESRESESTREP